MSLAKGSHKGVAMQLGEIVRGVEPEKKEKHTGSGGRK
jgi:hypothetical protein